jgi:hypothetical protein
MANRLMIVALAATLLATATTAVAQSAGSATTTTPPTAELSAGYQLVRVGEVCDSGAITQTCRPNRAFPLGFAGDYARNFGSWGLVAEGGWSADSESSSTLDVSFHTWHMAGGGRWTSRRHAHVWPHGQVLLGFVQDRVSGTLNGANVDDSRTSFMLQMGGGATFPLGPGWGVVSQLDYRRVFLNEDENLSNGRNDVRLFLALRLILK